MLFSSKALLLLKLVSDLIQVSSHGTEVRYCLTNNSKLRIFIVHSHGDLSSASGAGTMDIQDVNTGVTSRLVPDGVINNKVNTNLVTVGDCQGDETFLAGACPDNSFNDWVYFDFDADCVTPPIYKLLQGNTAVLQAPTGCSLYPTTITLATACAVVTDSPSVSVVPSTTPTYVPSSVPSNFPSLLPSNIPSNAPSVCIDEPEWAFYSYTCSDIESFISGNAGTCDGMINYTYFDKNVKEACCVCGGGLGISRVPSSTPSTLPSVSITPSKFISSTPSITPSQFISSTPSVSPSDFPSSVPSLSPSSSPSLTHSGNPSMVATDVPSQTPSVCIDEPGWKFLSVYSCAEVEAFIAIKENFCDGIFNYRHLDKNLKEACCACGGGIGVSRAPSLSPSALPSITSNPSEVPSTVPSSIPSDIPSSVPSSVPSDLPSDSPSDQPSSIPSSLPSALPSLSPSDQPSSVPSSVPSLSPSDQPSSVPSSVPSDLPSDSPSDQPSSILSSLPSALPSLSPSDQPSSVPSSVPSDLPSDSPSDQPSSIPSSLPSALPSSSPTSSPTEAPTMAPTMAPTEAPTKAPILSPTSAPTESPIVFCADSITDFRFRKGKVYVRKNCEWVNSENTVKKKERCDLYNSHCPATCAEYFTPACTTDSEQQFVFNKKTEETRKRKGCKWVAKRKTSRCKNSEFAATCRKTCKPEICEDSPFNEGNSSSSKWDCGFIGRNKVKRCRNKTTLSLCPQTCSKFGGLKYCSKNATSRRIWFKWLRTKRNYRKCRFVAKKPLKRCALGGIKETCRATCASF